MVWVGTCGVYIKYTFQIRSCLTGGGGGWVDCSGMKEAAAAAVDGGSKVNNDGKDKREFFSVAAASSYSFKDGSAATKESLEAISDVFSIA